jgi:hypothetical protein
MDDTSPTTSMTALPVRLKRTERREQKKAKQAERKAMREAKATGDTHMQIDDEQANEDSAPQPFFVDTNPTPVDPDQVMTTDEQMQSKSKKEVREERLLAEKKKRLQKKYKVPEGSTEPHKEVDADLARYVQKREKQLERNGKVRMHKAQARRGRTLSKKRRKAEERAEKKAAKRAGKPAKPGKPGKKLSQPQPQQ